MNNTLDTKKNIKLRNEYTGQVATVVLQAILDLHREIKIPSCADDSDIIDGVIAAIDGLDQMASGGDMGDIHCNDETYRKIARKVSRVIAENLSPLN